MSKLLTQLKKLQEQLSDNSHVWHCRLSTEKENWPKEGDYLVVIEIYEEQ